MWVRARLSLLLVFIATAQAADTADALPTLFDFLGAMVEQEGEWVDALDMEQSFQELEGNVVDAANTSIDTGAVSEAEPALKPNTVNGKEGT